MGAPGAIRFEREYSCNEGNLTWKIINHEVSEPNGLVGLITDNKIGLTLFPKLRFCRFDEFSEKFAPKTLEKELQCSVSLQILDKPMETNCRNYFSVLFGKGVIGRGQRNSAGSFRGHPLVFSKDRSLQEVDRVLDLMKWD